MILVALTWVMAQAGYLLEGAIDIVVPDSVLGIIRTALNGTGTDLLKAATFRFEPATLQWVAAAVDLQFLLFFLRMAVRGYHRVKGMTPWG